MSSDLVDKEGKGYADDKVATSSSSSGVAAGQGAVAVDSAASLDQGNSADLLEDNDVPEEVAIHVDSVGAWDDKPRDWPVVPGYDWAPPDVRQISSSFYHRRPFRELAGKVCLVKVAEDATHFKLVMCKMTKRRAECGSHPAAFERLGVYESVLYRVSYKDFKGNFFKVVPLEAGYTSFCFPDERAKFPFYWTNNPKKVISWPKSRMTPEELDLISQLSQLPRKSSSRVLISFLNNKNLHSNVFDYLTEMDPAKSSTFAHLFAQRGGEIRKTVEGSSSRTSTTVAILVTSLPIQKTQLPPLVKKGKRKAARESSVSSKRSKRALPDGPPLSRPLSSNSWVTKRIHFDLFAEEKDLVKGMTEDESSNMALELVVRSTMCLA
ncbi:hypothetical protein LR48_Vigan02g051600 [Vigna angularis]|uniref:Uncharacterized protein n=1 Tax=Phaseolus angularis TaxID=3914 RepID=A0A0L9TV38_PHAAN|nr:hypothetical protein LR48_Vigan02g051600 [Vigna angularis]